MAGRLLLLLIRVMTIKKNLKLYFKLFASTFTISAFTFGGGYVIVPLMRKKFVEKLKWINEKEMLDFVAIGQSAPGPIAVNTSILVGHRLAGVAGALVTVFGTVLPPLIVLSAVFLLYKEFKGNAVVNAVMAGMRIGVATVIVDAVITMAKNVLKGGKVLPLLLMAAAFAAAFFFKVNLIIILGASALAGIAVTFYKLKRGKGAAS